MTDLNLKFVADVQTFWYLGQPYTGHPEGALTAYRQGCEAAGWLLQHRVPVYAPIAHSHPIAETGAIPHDDHETWLWLDERMMTQAHGLLVLQLPGWETSYGLTWERDWFAARDRPIVFVPWPLRESE